jgi:hypothetical protein
MLPITSVDMEPVLKPEPFSRPAAEAEGAAALPKYLTLRGGVYYFKRKYPTDVVHPERGLPAQVWKSLGTSDLTCAVQKLAAELKAFEDNIDRARGKVAASPRKPARGKKPADGTTKYLLEAHIPAVLERYTYAYLQADDEQRRHSTREERQEMLREANEGLEYWYDAAAADDFSAIEETADMLLSGERLIAPPGTKVRARFLAELMRKEIELLELVRDRLRGRMTLTAAEPPIGARHLTTLTDLFDHWKKTQGRLRTVDTYQGYVQDFETLHGALPVVAISKQHVFALRDWLASQGLARPTVCNRVKGLMTLVNKGLADAEIKLESNPFTDIDFDCVPETPASELRRPYYVEELQRFFRSKLYTEGYRPEGQSREALYWAPLLATFAGPRIEELAQLTVGDVRTMQGVWVLRIVNLDAEQHLKNEGSFRTVPVHPELVRCGLLRYVESVKAAGHERLFPSLRNDNKYELWSNSLGKAYSRYLDDIGLDDPRLDFHSYRYTFRQQCAICGVEPEIRDALTGHWVSKNEGGRTYLQDSDRQYPLEALVAAMKKLVYKELDLSHLRVT